MTIARIFGSYDGTMDAENILEFDCKRTRYGWEVRDAIAKRLETLLVREHDRAVKQLKRERALARKKREKEKAEQEKKKTTKKTPVKKNA